MQLRDNHPELIKSKISNYVIKQVLEGRIRDRNLIELVFQYFHGNPQLFEEHQSPTINYHQNKVCYSCGLKGHIKRNCKVQGLAEEEIEWVYSKPIKKQKEIIKRREVFRQPEVPFKDIPDDLPYEIDPYED